MRGSFGCSGRSSRHADVFVACGGPGGHLPGRLPLRPRDARGGESLSDARGMHLRRYFTFSLNLERFWSFFLTEISAGLSHIVPAA